MRALAILLLFILPLCAAIPTGTGVNWDVRTGGSDTNGGAFDSGVGSPGTDESQANAGTSVTITIQSTTTQGISVPAFTATTHGPGNFVNITSGTGCTIGRYDLQSQSAGTGTFDRSLGTAASVCTGTLGGSLQTLATAAAAIGSGNVINVHSGTYTFTSQLATNIAGIWIGYNSTHGDRGTKPLWTTSTNSTNLVQVGGNANQSFRNISFSNTAGTRGVAIVGAGSSWIMIDDSVFDGFSVALSGGAQAWGLSSVEIKNSVSEAITLQTLALNIEASWIHDNGGSAVNPIANNENISISNSILSANANGVATSNNATYSLWMTNCDVANNTTDGVNFGTNSATLATVGSNGFTNNIFYGNGRYGVNFSGGSANGQGDLAGSTNAYGANGTANYNGVNATPGDLALTANPFTSSTNFALNSTAGGGPVVKGTGYPGVFPGGATTGTINVGAVQGSSGGGATQFAYPR